MKDYKDTLNLPTTAFPMKASLNKREPEILQFWDTIDLYAQLRARHQHSPKFVLHDGPPYANGPIHLGTTLNKVLKDITLKSKTLSGFDTPYVPGWDCHGLPIEHKVESKIGKAGDKVSPKAFRKACREFAASQVDLQREDFRRLGVLGEWQNPYLTMNYTYEANVVRALAKMIANGHLHRGQKPVHWCTACASALAEAEVEYQDKSSPSIDVGFDVMDVQKCLAAFALNNNNITQIIVPIWTTTPWTLPGNQAVSVSPVEDYVLVSAVYQGKTYYFIFAQALAEKALERYGMTDYQMLAQVKGEALENILLQHPLYDRHVPIILGDHVTIEEGTGNVHTAPAHGPDDYEVCLKYNLPVDNPVDSRSCFLSNIPLVGGLHVFKSNDVVIDALKQRGKLFAHKTLQHSYPHCWRHKTPLIFRATPQWFISMEKQNLRQHALDAIAKVSWMPSSGISRIATMVASRPDWCISRQRTWGIPLSLFIHKNSGELHPDTIALMEKVAQRIEKSGVDAWFDLTAEELLGEQANHYEKINDILDVWFDSGVSHACVLDVRPQLHRPAELYLEGSDQHRGWFQTSLLSSLAICNAPPFQAVLTHGYVVDGKGRKMSKSLGNTIAPSEVISKMGADILRLWAAASDYSKDVNFSDEILTRISDAYRRIRNTARFLLSNLADFDPTKDQVAGDNLLALDRFALEITQQLQQQILQAYEQYRFQSIYQFIHNFCSVDMGSFYLDVIKDRQYTSKTTGLPRRSSQTAMYHILRALVGWLAPILSFTAEEIWQHMPGEREESVFLTQWYKDFPTYTQAKTQLDWPWLMQVRDEVNKLLEVRRKQGDIGSALDANIILYANTSIYDKLAKLGNELRFVLITSDASVKLADQVDQEALSCAIEGLKIKVCVSTHEKCERCWQRREDVNHDANHPGLCGRCVENIAGIGEKRLFA